VTDLLAKLPCHDREVRSVTNQEPKLPNSLALGTRKAGLASGGQPFVKIESLARLRRQLRDA
jgi:hypothetical protein